MDITIYESGNGGEIVKSTTDISTTEAVWNNVYLALFGGLLAEVHEDEEDSDEASENNGYWQNNLFNPEDTSGHVNARTEHELAHFAMTSEGVFELQQVVMEDLDYLNEIGEVSVNVSLINNDKISILVELSESEEGEDISVNLIWDATRAELIEKRII